jgi:hypothetical protein
MFYFTPQWLTLISLKLKVLCWNISCQHRTLLMYWQSPILIRPSKTAHKAKTRKTKINFPLLPEKKQWEQRSVCERKELLCISYKWKPVNRLLIYRGITVYNPLKHTMLNPVPFRCCKPDKQILISKTSFHCHQKFCPNISYF